LAASSPVGPALPLLRLTLMPRHWLWMQVAIVVFVLAGMVIAITKLA
jgi:hypothetical protein